jgi:glycosyltransferase involved in cell wall biosynthesis
MLMGLLGKLSAMIKLHHIAPINSKSGGVYIYIDELSFLSKFAVKFEQTSTELSSFWGGFNLLKGLAKDAIVHCHTQKQAFYFSLIQFFISGRIFVYSPHGIRHRQCRNIFKRSLHFFVEVFISFSCDRVCCISLSEYYFYRLFLKKQKVVFIPSISSLNRSQWLQSESTLLNKVVLENKSLKFISVGSVDSRKNPIAFIMAASKILKDCATAEFIWIGGGPDLNKCKELVKELNISSNVKFVGAVPHSEVLVFLRGATHYIHLSEAEGMPLSILEAMGVGLGCIVAPFDAAYELLMYTGNVRILDDVNAESIRLALQEIVNHSNSSAFSEKLSPVYLDNALFLNRYSVFYRNL